MKRIELNVSRLAILNDYNCIISIKNKHYKEVMSTTLLSRSFIPMNSFAVYGALVCEEASSCEILVICFLWGRELIALFRCRCCSNVVSPSLKVKSPEKVVCIAQKYSILLSLRIFEVLLMWKSSP